MHPFRPFHRLPNLAESLQAITDRLGPIGMLGVALTGGGLLVAIGYVVGLGTGVTDHIPGGIKKEVGFTYAPNWTVVYMVLFPLYLFAFGLLLNARNAFFKQGTQIPSTRFITGPQGAQVTPNRVRDIWEVKLRRLSPFLYILMTGVAILTTVQWVVGSLIPFLSSEIGSQVVDWSTAAYLHDDPNNKIITFGFSTYAYTYMGIALFLYLSVLAWMPHFSTFLMEISDETVPLRIVLRGAELSECFRRFATLSFAITTLGLCAAYFMRLQATYLNSVDTWVFHFAFQEIKIVFEGKEWFSQPEWLPEDRQIASSLTSYLVLCYTALMYFASTILLARSFNRFKLYYLRKIGDPHWRREMGLQYDSSFVELLRRQSFTSQIMPQHWHMYLCLLVLAIAIRFPWYGSFFLISIVYAAVILVWNSNPANQLPPVQPALSSDSPGLTGVLIQMGDAAEIATLFRHHATCFIAPNQFYTSVVERSHMPDEYREHIKDKINSVASDEKASELVRVASDQGYMPREFAEDGRLSTVLGSMLVSLRERVGLEFQCFIVEKLEKCALVDDAQMLAELNHLTCQRWIKIAKP